MVIGARKKGKKEGKPLGFYPPACRELKGKRRGGVYNVAAALIR